MQKFLQLFFVLALLLPFQGFAAQLSPSVETKNAKNITYNSADIYATVTGGSAEDNGYWFEWGVVGAYEDVVFRTQRRTVSVNAPLRTVNTTLRGLAPKTQYYFRIVADNQQTTTSGQVVYFTTRDLEEEVTPVVLVTTRGTSSVRDNTAKVFGYVAPHQGSAEYWFDYGTTDKLTQHTDTKRISGNGSEINFTLKELVSGTTYYYRVVAENDRGVTYGGIKSFKTTGEKPAVEAKSKQVTTKAVSRTTASSKTTTSSSGGFLSGLFGSSGKATSTVVASKTASKTNLVGAVGDSTKDVVVTTTMLGTVAKGKTLQWNVSYKYNRTVSASDAELVITLPSSVQYAGDSTINELLVDDNTNGTHTLTLPIGTIKKGDTGKVNVMGIYVGKTTENPRVLASLVFVEKNGKKVNVAAIGATQKTNSSSSFPTTLIVWLVALNLFAVALILMVKAKDWYMLAQSRALENDNIAANATANIYEQISPAHNEPVPAFVSVIQHEPTSVPLVTPIPKKPKIFDEYQSVRVQDVGLPGMEVIRDDQNNI